jgi:hypothetical protein
LSCGGKCISITADFDEDDMWKPSTDLFLHISQFDKIIPVDFE